MSFKHLQKYVDEYSNRLNMRTMDNTDQINRTIQGLVGKQFIYKDLVP